MLIYVWIWFKFMFLYVDIFPVGLAYVWPDLVFRCNILTLTSEN
jgi:hypothetical protein